MASKKKRWQRYKEAVAKLKEKGIKYETVNNDLELVFEDGTKYWPTTGTIMQDGKRLEVQGIEALLKAVVA